MIAVIKSTFKLMIRNKVFLFFLLLAPVLTVIILNIKVSEKPETDAGLPVGVIELPSCDERSIYYTKWSDNAYAFSIKVYDDSGSELSEYVLEQLAANGMFAVCRADAGGMTEDEVIAQAELDAFMDRAGCLLYLKRDFDRAVMEGDIDSALQIFVVSDDERLELMELELSDLIGQIKAAQTVCGNDSNAILEMLGKIDENMPAKKTLSIAAKNDVRLTMKQEDQHSLFTNASAFCMFGFLFAGIYIAHTIIEEKNNKVFTRMMLSKVGEVKYFSGKFAAMLLINILQAVVLAVCLLTVLDADFGFSLSELMILMFPQGLIFSALGMMLGILIGDVMSSNYASFAVWAISSMLGGSWFPMNASTDAIKALSSVMPQKIFGDAAKMLLTGDRSGYFMILLTVAAYLLVIISLGCVGLKMQKQEQ